MIDPFVLLTPILLLAVAALLGFLGCDLVFPPGPGPVRTIAEVAGQRTKGQFDNATSTSVAFPANVTANNLLVVAGTVWRDNGGTTITISDTLGTLYTARTFVSTTDGNYRPFIAWGIAPTSGENTVTVTAGLDGAYCSFGMDEFSGVDAASPLDTDGGGVSGGPDTAPTSSLTTGVANALIVGTMSVQSGAVVFMTPGSGYTEIAEEEDNTNHQSFHAEFQIVTTAQDYTVDWTLGTSSAWDLYHVSFKR
jgi:hypothetical protein